MAVEGKSFWLVERTGEWHRASGAETSHANPAGHLMGSPCTMVPGRLEPGGAPSTGLIRICRGVNGPPVLRKAGSPGCKVKPLGDCSEA